MGKVVSFLRSYTANSPAPDIVNDGVDGLIERRRIGAVKLLIQISFLRWLNAEPNQGFLLDSL